MLRYYRSALRTHALLLMRDPSALLLLFVMPLAMVFIVTLIQKAAFDQMGSLRMRLLILDCDRDTLGISLKRKFSGMEGMTVALESSQDCIAGADEAARMASSGEWQAVVYLKPGTSEALMKQATVKANQFLQGVNDTLSADSLESPAAGVFFAPEVSGLVRLLLFQGIDRIVQALSAGFIVNEMTRSMGLTAAAEPSESLAPLRLEEMPVGEGDQRLDAVTHNIPSWTVFALFFIVVPMATGIVRERDSGLRRRLATLPHPLWLYDLARVSVYMLVCMLQALLIFVAGVWIFPLMGLGQLPYQALRPELLLILVVTAFAATSFGQAVGSLSQSHEQAAAFGSLSVVILAALGGLWVPHFVMPPALKAVAAISPLHWALQCLYNTVLGTGSPAALAGFLLRLSGFGLLMLILASWHSLVKRLRRPWRETRHPASAF